MLSPAKLLANRRNAPKSTGPKSPAGKARSSRNAVKHALSAWTPPGLPGESSAAFNSFANAVALDLQPVGPVESLWASRIALLLWRLRRIQQHESALAADRLRDADLVAPQSPRWQHRYKNVQDLPSSIHSIKSLVRDLKKAIPLLHQALSANLQPDDQGPTVDSHTAVKLAQFASQHLGWPLSADPGGDPFPGIGDLAPNQSAFHYHWTLSMVRESLQTIAEEEDLDFHDFLHHFVPSLPASLGAAVNQLRRANRELAHFRQSCAVPDLQTLRSLDRHEAALERNLSRALSQLAFLQSQRLATASPNVTSAPQNVLPPSPNVTDPSQNVTPVALFSPQTPEIPA